MTRQHNLSEKCLYDDNTGISHVFEMRIGMNEFDDPTLVLLKQQ